MGLGRAMSLLRKAGRDGVLGVLLMRNTRSEVRWFRKGALMGGGGLGGGYEEGLETP